MPRKLYPKWSPDLLEAFEVMTGYVEAREALPRSAGVARQALRTLYDRRQAAREALEQYKVEVGTASCAPDAWSSNEMVFDTIDAAIDYARDLAGRLLAVTRWRVVTLPGTLRVLHDPANKAFYSPAK